MTNTLKIRAICMRSRSDIRADKIAQVTGIPKPIVQMRLHDMARRGELIRMDVNVYRKNPDFIPDRIAMPAGIRKVARPVRPSRALDLLEAAWR